MALGIIPSLFRELNSVKEDIKIKSRIILLVML